MSELVLNVKDLSAGYTTHGLFGRKTYKEVIKDVSFSIAKGEILGLVGGSGTGKTTLAKAVLGLIKPEKGVVESFTKKPQMIFQDPLSSLNPAFTIQRILEEPLILRGIASKTEREERVRETAGKVRLGESSLRSRPSELSGGQRQRVSIASALLCDPGLIVADEPVSALDVTIEAEILELISELRRDTGISFLFISHDLNVIYKICDRVIVMNNGMIIEEGETRKLFRSPENRYTKALLSAALET
ncbi:MAG: ABC transporter ATP-binding protein [Oscillospiraceae bacterium]|nr:ABC transporter ATP-binding protein [Oscillospiraceae bacterium]